jgi:colicin import membrane protein
VLKLMLKQMLKQEVKKEVNFMRVVPKAGLVILALLCIASCSSTSSQITYTPGSGTDSTSGAESQQVMKEQGASAQKQAEEREREAEEALAAESLEAERQAQLAAQRQAEEAARQEADRQRELTVRRAAEQARFVQAQQARIDQLRSQIADNEASTNNLDAANTVLRQAIAAAEQLTDALAAEDEKYNSTDPVSGAPLEELASARLERLSEEVDVLSDQVEALMAQP